METRTVAVPRCTLVAGQIDLSTGGEGGDPDEKAKTLIDQGLPMSKRRKNETEKQAYQRD